jgi:hypothetical protein
LKHQHATKENQLKTKERRGVCGTKDQTAKNTTTQMVINLINHPKIFD